MLNALSSLFLITAVNDYQTAKNINADLNKVHSINYSFIMKKYSVAHLMSNISNFLSRYKKVWIKLKDSLNNQRKEIIIKF